MQHRELWPFLFSMIMREAQFLTAVCGRWYLVMLTAEAAGADLFLCLYWNHRDQLEQQELWLADQLMYHPCIMNCTTATAARQFSQVIELQWQNKFRKCEVVATISGTGRHPFWLWCCGVFSVAWVCEWFCRQVWFIAVSIAGDIFHVCVCFTIVVC